MCIFVPFFCEFTITNVGLQCNVNMSFTQPVLPANDGLLRALYFLAQLFFSQIKMPLRLIAGRLARVSSWWTLETPECRNYTTHTKPFWTRMARHTLPRYRRNFHVSEMTLTREWPWKILSFAQCSYPNIETVMLIHNRSACCSYLYSWTGHPGRPWICSMLPALDRWGWHFPLLNFCRVRVGKWCRCQESVQT